MAAPMSGVLSRLLVIILLLISGLEPNPGPRRPRFPCTVCSKACKANQMALACDDCDCWTHKDCVGLSTTSYNRLGDSDETWTCPQCHTHNSSSKIYSVPIEVDTSTTTVSNQTQQMHTTQESSMPSDVSSPGLSSTSDSDPNLTHSLHDSSIPTDTEIGMTSSP
ncbi:hypothetical protein ACOMHN_056753 [Nucella lapillus]